MQCACKERLVDSGHLQSLSLFVVPHNQQAFSIHTLPQHLRLPVVRHLDPKHQAVLKARDSFSGENIKKKDLKKLGSHIKHTLQLHGRL